MRNLILIPLILVSLLSAHAEDKMGLRLSISKKTLSRADGRGDYNREIDRTMALKAQIKNISSKDMPAGTIDCVILIKRWGLSETGSVQRYTKSIPLEAMRTAVEQELLVGDYHIGGHMHGTSDMHVDQLAGWKVTVTLGDKKIEYVSSSSFESMNKRAKDGA